ncbi:hypothetical protein BpHYR1_041676 [Brachionus plicatilis]|uniref:Uncharacterized protein n=1 Tax=Brachionus plicatilis TaxID=10195 RepID=A0A3M7STV9_BRAPC|nr:hypothetical protein BpHYR1_041676 [Brachionus plicatilis]
MQKKNIPVRTGVFLTSENLKFVESVNLTPPVFRVNEKIKIINLTSFQKILLMIGFILNKRQKSITNMNNLLTFLLSDLKNFHCSCCYSMHLYQKNHSSNILKADGDYIEWLNLEVSHQF